MVSFSIQALWFKDHLSAGYTRPKITPNLFLNNCFPSQKNRSIRSNDSVLSRHAHFFNWGIPGDCRFHTSPNLSQNTNIRCWPVKGFGVWCWILHVDPLTILLESRSCQGFMTSGHSLIVASGYMASLKMGLRVDGKYLSTWRGNTYQSHSMASGHSLIVAPGANMSSMWVRKPHWINLPSSQRRILKITTDMTYKCVIPCPKSTFDFHLVITWTILVSIGV